MQSIKVTQNTLSLSTWVKDLVIIAFMLSLFYAFLIGSHALFTPDEGRYSEVAREMVATGDYITPRLNGVAFLDKPVLYYWLQASAIVMFGLKEWALRFWPALMGVFGCLIAYAAGRVMFSRRAGVISALVLATSPLYFGAAHYANLDLEVAVLISTSLLFFIMSAQTPSSLHKGFLISAYVFASLAALTKGLIGIAFPVMIIGTWIVLLNRWSLIPRMRILTGFVLFMLITVPWYVLVQKANPQFFEFFFIKQQVARFLTTEHFNNRTTWWFYIPIVIAGLFPWCVFIAQAIFQAAKKCWQQKQASANQLFLLIWFFLIFTFFSFPKSKTVGYILPVFPPAALLIGYYLDTIWENAKRSQILTAAISFIIICIGVTAFSLYAPFITILEVEPLLIPYLKINAFIFALAGSITLLQVLLKKSLRAILLTIFATSIAFSLLMLASCDALNQKTIKPITTQLKPFLTDNDEVVAYYKYYQDLPIYLERRITIVADWQAPDIGTNDNWRRELWYGMPFQDTSDWLINEDAFWKRWHSSKRLFVLTDEGYYEQFKQNAKSPVYKIAQYNQRILLSNKNINIAAR